MPVMSELSIYLAHKSPTAGSDDIRTPFSDLGMHQYSDDQLGELFAGKTVLDVGSGFEGIARRLFHIFGNLPNAPAVTNLNPQFTDWRYDTVHDADGRRHTIKRSKQDDIEAAIREAMERYGEDQKQYFAQRIARPGLVQELPFLEESFHIVTSTWGFPTCMYDCGGGYNHDLTNGYIEIQRVMKAAGGIALLAPIRGCHIQHAERMLKEALAENVSYDLRPTDASSSSDTFLLQLTKA